MVAGSASPGVSDMPAQEQKLNKNYIGILCDRVEEQRAADLPAKSGRLMKDYFLGLIAAVLKRHGDAR
jgi:hypothetical protein